MPPTPDAKFTQYLVLVQTGDGVWQELATVNASSQSGAKSKALADHRPEGGTVVAVPKHSWKPEDKRPKLTFI